MIMKNIRPKVTERLIAKGLLHPKVKYAFFPTRLHNNNWVWLEHYLRVPVGVYYDGKLQQCRVGGDWGDDGKYFPHGNFSMNDNSYFSVDNVPSPLMLLMNKAGE